MYFLPITDETCKKGGPKSTVFAVEHTPNFEPVVQVLLARRMATKPLYVLMDLL